MENKVKTSGEMRLNKKEETQDKNREAEASRGSCLGCGAKKKSEEAEKMRNIAQLPKLKGVTSAFPFEGLNCIFMEVIDEFL